MFLFTIPTYIDYSELQCKINYCYESRKEEILKDYVDKIKIRWYCKWCNWQKDMYDCSSFISNYLINKWMLKRRINTYILANYWIEISESKAKIWHDIVVFINKWTWANHTAIYMWDWYIYDTYILKKSFSKRYMWNTKEYQIKVIWNPEQYWFKKSFYKIYKNLLWKNHL